MTTYRRNPSVESAPTQNETLLFLPEANRFCLLNRSAAVLWAALEQPRTQSELAAALRQAYRELDESRADADVADAVRELSDLALITAD